MIAEIKSSPKLNDFFFSVDGKVLSVEFVRKLIDKMTETSKSIENFGTLSIRTTRRQCSDIIKKLDQFPNLQGAILWFRPTILIGGPHGHGADLSGDELLEDVVGTVKNLKQLKNLNLDLPLLMTSQRANELRTRVRKLNPKLNIGVETQLGFLGV